MSSSLYACILQNLSLLTVLFVKEKKLWKSVSSFCFIFSFVHVLNMSLSFFSIVSTCCSFVLRQESFPVITKGCFLLCSTQNVCMRNADGMLNFLFHLKNKLTYHFICIDSLTLIVSIYCLVYSITFFCHSTSF